MTTTPPVNAYIPPMFWYLLASFEVLRITDGTDTIDLLDPDGLILAREGYGPIPAFEDDNGNWPDVEETIRCHWMKTTEDNRASDWQKLNRLARKARLYKREKGLRLGQFVWLEASRYHETKTRYALIKNIVVPGLSPKHWGQAQPVPVTLVIKREGPWRGISPDGTPTTAVNAETIEQFTDSNSKTNYVDIDAADVPGDVPALCEITVDTSSLSKRSDNLLVVPRTMDTTTRTNFNPFFNAGDELDNVGSHAASTDWPDDEWIHLSGAGSTTLRWSVNLSVFQYYFGTYNVYCACEASSDSAVQIRFSDGVQTGDYVDAPDVTASYDAKMLYLGRFTLPWGNHVPASLGLAANQDIKIDVTITGAEDFYLGYVYLARVDQPFYLKAADTPVLIDGSEERAYSVDSSGNLTSGIPVRIRGRYITLPPNEPTRLWFFVTRDDATEGDDLIEDFSRTMDVTVKVIPRFTSIRGNV